VAIVLPIIGIAMGRIFADTMNLMENLKDWPPRRAQCGR